MFLSACATFVREKHINGSAISGLDEGELEMYGFCFLSSHYSVLSATMLLFKVRNEPLGPVGPSGCLPLLAQEYSEGELSGSAVPLGSA
jgi:hypothetical protein